MLTEEQKSNRKNGIGASDSPIIMGYSSYKTPYQLYLEKIGILTDEEEDTEQQYWGKVLEPLIVKRFSEENDLEVTFPDTVYHPNHPFIFANLDGWIPSENAVVEAKCANSYQRKEWDMAADDGIPISYLIQIAKQVAITNASKGYCAVLIGGMEYKQFTYHRDVAFESLIIESDIEFWNCVVNRIEPAPSNTSDCRLKYKTPHPDKIAPATFKVSQLFSELSAVRSQTKNLTEREEYYKMMIMDHMKNAEYLMEQSGEILVTWKANKKGTRVFNIKG